MTTSFAFLGGAYAVGGSDKMDVKSVQAVHAQQAYITPPRCVWRSDVGEIDRLANQPVTKSEDQPRDKTGVME